MIQLPRCRRAVLSLRLPLALTIVCLGVSRAAAQNPFPNPMGQSSFTIPVETFATLPTDEVPGGSVQRPLAIELAPSYDGTGRLFVNSLRGPLYSISANGSTVTEYLDLRDWGINLINADMQRGLQGFAFHPEFNTVGQPGYGKFYTLHSATNTTAAVDFGPNSGETHHEVLLEWDANTPTAATYDGGAPREMMRIGEPEIDHNTRTLAFNRNVAPGHPDYGKLYMSLGDGGGVGNPHGLGGTGTTPFGAILRIDPLGNNSANGDYGIPADNPFVGGDPKLDEIYAYGFRNPQHFSFDSGGTHQIFVGDIGQGVIEEINIVQPGGHYGWSAREGSYVYISDGVIGADTSDSGDGYIYPIAEYDQVNFVSNPSWSSAAVAVAGGYVYRDHQYSPLYGKYVFADFVAGRLMYIDADNPPDGGQDGITELRVTDNGVVKTMFQLINDAISPDTTRADMRFGVGENGEIFMVNKWNSRVYVLRPQRLSDGDHNGDGAEDAADIDLLCHLIEAGDPDGDLNGDMLVNQDDMDYMISTILGTTYGDADLDGDVDGADFDAWRIRDSLGGGIGWATGDFDCDGDVDGADFDLWRLRPTSISGGDLLTVPEPSALALLAIGIPGLLAVARLRRI